MYKVFIDGVERHSVENSKACQLGNVKVYAGDPWHQAQPGVINDLTVKIKNPWSTVFEWPDRFPLSKKNLSWTLRMPNVSLRLTVILRARAVRGRGGRHKPSLAGARADIF